MEDEGFRMYEGSQIRPSWDTNKRRKFEEVIGSIFLSYVNDRVDFYQKFENPTIRQLIVDEFYRDYR